MFNIANSHQNGGNTYFFGTNGGADTISFGVNNTYGSGQGRPLTLAFSDSYGITSASISYDTNSSSSLVVFGSSSQSVFITGVTSSAGVANNTVSAFVNVKSVTNATITAFG